MRSEFSSDERGGQPQLQQQQNQFVEDIGQSVANELFGYSTGNENHETCNQENINALRPKRSTTRKAQQVSAYYFPLCAALNFMLYYWILFLWKIY